MRSYIANLIQATLGLRKKPAFMQPKRVSSDSHRGEPSYVCITCGLKHCMPRRTLTQRTRPACPKCGGILTLLRTVVREQARTAAEVRRQAKIAKIQKTKAEAEKKQNIVRCPICRNKVQLPCKICEARAVAYS